MSAQMSSELVMAALQRAIRERKPSAGLTHHSDRGSQYTGTPYQQLLKDNRFQVSMSGTGSCYNNAPAESFLGSLKMEWVHHTIYETRAQTCTDIFFTSKRFTIGSVAIRRWTMLARSLMKQPIINSS